MSTVKRIAETISTVLAAHHPKIDLFASDGYLSIEATVDTPDGYTFGVPRQTYQAGADPEEIVANFCGVAHSTITMEVLEMTDFDQVRS